MILLTRVPGKRFREGLYSVSGYSEKEFYRRALSRASKKINKRLNYAFIAIFAFVQEMRQNNRLTKHATNTINNLSVTHL